MIDLELPSRDWTRNEKSARLTLNPPAIIAQFRCSVGCGKSAGSPFQAAPACVASGWPPTGCSAGAVSKLSRATGAAAATSSTSFAVTRGSAGPCRGGGTCGGHPRARRLHRRRCTREARGPAHRRRICRGTAREAADVSVRCRRGRTIRRHRDGRARAGDPAFRKPPVFLENFLG